jgi:hypothetical protein
VPLRYRLFAVILFLLVAERPACVAADSGSPPSEQRFQTAKRGKPIILPVRIGPNNYSFLLDTGSAVTSVDVSLKGLLGPASRTARVYSLSDATTSKMQLFAAPQIWLGRTPLRGASEVLCVDYRAVGLLVDGRLLDGFLGMDALGALIVRIDFNQGEVSLLSSIPSRVQAIPLVGLSTSGLGVASQRPISAYAVKETTSVQTPTRRAISERPAATAWPRLSVPCVRAEIGGLTSPYVCIDTGNLCAASGTLDSSCFRTLVAAGDLSIVGQSAHTTINGTVRTRAAQLAQLRLGKFEHAGLLFDEGARNSLSLAYFAPYVVTFDFPGRRLFLSPSGAEKGSEPAL